MALRSRLLPPLAAFFLPCLAACATTNPPAYAPAAPPNYSAAPTTPDQAPVALSETGSTLLFPLLTAWASAYHQQYSQVTISTAGTAASPSGPAAAPSTLAAGPAGPAEAASPAPAGAPAEQCPNCGSDRAGQFCETCGFDFSAAPAAAGPAWTAVVSADRDYFDSVIAADGPDAATIQFPAYCPERRFRLTGREMRIGRHSAARGLEPEIDLTGPPTDAGISHLHAVLTAGPDGGWSVLDPGSSNGTQVNGSEIAVGVPVPLHDGDRIGVGGWTVLRIQVS